MSERPFMQFYPSDFIGDTMHLTAEQIGAYMLLLMTMWNAGGKLPNDDRKLSRISRIAPQKWHFHKSELMAFFEASDDGYITHSRLNRELEKAIGKSAKRSECGAIGGAAKALKDKEATLAKATVLPQHLPDTITRKIEGANAPYSSEPEESAPSAVAFLPTVSDGDFPFFETDVDEWAKAFPAVDVRQQLAAMRSWLIANPTKRKTKRGMRKFVVAWLDRKQNSGASPVQRATSPPNGKRQNAVEAMEEIFRDKGWTQENEPEFLPSHNRDAQFLPSERRDEQSAVVDLRPGTDWRARSGH